MLLEGEAPHSKRAYMVNVMTLVVILRLVVGSRCHGDYLGGVTTPWAADLHHGATCNNVTNAPNIAIHVDTLHYVHGGTSTDCISDEVVGKQL
jgi:hypothetical protein